MLDIVSESVDGFLEIRLGGRDARSVHIVSFSLHGLLRVKELLSCSLAFHLSFFEYLSIGRCLLPEVVLSGTVHLICFVCLSCGRHDRHEMSLLDSMLRRRSLKHLEDWVVDIFEKLSFDDPLFAFLQLREDGSLGHKVFLFDGLPLLYVRVDLHLCIGSLLELLAHCMLKL